ncbi:MAG: hypothetical protein ACI92E_001668, partial [Oceanicoccus sp.]
MIAIATLLQQSAGLTKWATDPMIHSAFFYRQKEET